VSEGLVRKLPEVETVKEDPERVYRAPVVLILKVFAKYDALELECSHCGTLVPSLSHAIIVFDRATGAVKIVCKRTCGRATRRTHPSSVELLPLVSRMLPRRGEAR
jgi:hypothetical protein